MRDRLIVALDVPTIHDAKAMVERLGDTVSFYKIGIWMAFAEGVDGLIRSLTSAGKKVFLDSKMYDIPRTVEEGVRRAAGRGIDILTVHGDARIMAAAVSGARGTSTKIFTISVLSSLSDTELKHMGYAMTTHDLIHLRARQTVELGCDGLITDAAGDLHELRRHAGSDRLVIATPGIRSPGEASDDHARLATPTAAIEHGADYLVVGRPIIASVDPAARAREIIAEMETAFADEVSRSAVAARTSQSAPRSTEARP